MRPLFIASLGNPGAEYATTRHSAGHVLLKAITRLPQVDGTVFRADPGTHGQVSRSGVDANILFWQSSSFMNTSGKGLAAAWAAFQRKHSDVANGPSSTATTAADEDRPPLALRQVKLDPLTARPISQPSSPKKHVQRKLDVTSPLLVVLHDELELPLGVCKLSSGAGRSARGHNGLKSALSISALRQLDFGRVGVGIGPRPQGRGSDEVAKFVLARMTRNELDTIEYLAPKVWNAVERARTGQALSGKI